MAKKFSKLSLLLWGGVLLAVLFFVFGVGIREGFYAKTKPETKPTKTTETTTSTVNCSSYSLQGGCNANNCTWNSSSCSNNPSYNSHSVRCTANGGTYTGAYCS